MSYASSHASAGRRRKLRTRLLSVGLVTFLVAVIRASSTLATPIGSATLIAVGGVSPTINDSGEIVYVLSGSIVSTTRGVIVATGVDASNIGLSNSGEVVYADGTGDSHVISTVRGYVLGTATRTLAPSISPTTGEISYAGADAIGEFIASTVQGRFTAPDPNLLVNSSDVNDLGEVVYEYRLEPSTFSQIVSSTRGFLTPLTSDAFEPGINNLGEVVWSAFDSYGTQQIFSSTRGQLTFSVGPDAFTSANVPDINDEGVVVFRGIRDGVNGVYELAPAGESVPEPSSMLLLATGLGTLLRRSLRRD
jgi:hypothetical protein